MPSKKVLYQCKYCGEVFFNFDECETHEKNHIKEYDEADTAEIVKELRNLKENAYSWHIGYQICGIPVQNFMNLLEEAARRLEEK